MNSLLVNGSRSVTYLNSTHTHTHYQRPWLPRIISACSQKYCYSQGMRSVGIFSLKYLRDIFPSHSPTPPQSSLRAQGPFHPLRLARETPMRAPFPFPLALLSCFSTGECVCWKVPLIHGWYCNILLLYQQLLWELPRLWKLKNETTPKIDPACSRSQLPSHLSVGVKCFHLELLVAIQENAKRTERMKK